MKQILSHSIKTFLVMILISCLIAVTIEWNKKKDNYEVVDYIEYDKPLYSHMNGTSKSMYTRFEAEVRKHQNNEIEFIEKVLYDWFIDDKNFTFIPRPEKKNYLEK